MKQGFDIIDAVQKSYSVVWTERSYLMRLAAFPILLKFLAINSILFFDIDTPLRSELILLPAYFAEGWMIAHFTRLIFLNQRWPFKPSGDQTKDMAALNDRARGILSGMIAYVLMHMLMVFIFAGFRELPMEESDLQNPSLLLNVGAIAGFVLFLWAFRYLWIYIPLALNMGPRDYAKLVASPKISFHMLGTWMVCFMPAFLLIFFVSLPVLMPGEGNEIPPLEKVAVAWVQAMIEAFAALVITGGIAYGLKALMGGGQKEDRA